MKVPSPVPYLDLPTFARSVRPPSSASDTTRYVHVPPPDGVHVGHLEHLQSTHPLPTTYVQNFYCLYYVSEGTLEKLSQLQYVRVTQHQIYYTRPGQINSWRAVSGVCGFVMAFTPSFLRGTLSPLYHLHDFPFLSPDADALFELDPEWRLYFGRRFYRICQEQHPHREHHTELLRLWLQEVLLCTLRLQRKREHADLSRYVPSAAERLVSRFRAKVEEHFLRGYRQGRVPPRSVRAYADDLRVPVSSLNDAVKQVRGQTADSLVQDRTMLAAKTKLWHTEITVPEIAHFLGFNNVSYFTRAFKRHEGMTPPQFRQRRQSV